MVFLKFLIFTISVILLSLSTSVLVEYFHCRRPQYDPRLWNHGSIQTYNNCYIYALNRPKTSRTRKTSPGLGYHKGGGNKGTSDIGRDYSNYTCDYFDKLIKNDIPGAIKFDVDSVERVKCPSSHYEIALALDDEGDNDFHFYRKDCNTKYWSHKPGSSPVTKEDASGKLILDPQKSDRDFPNHNYNNFCGYYCIPNKPNVYEDTKRQLGL